MSKPFFSVICPTHNGTDRLPVSLFSVTMQTYTDYELIVVCDACDDDSASVAESYGAKVIRTDFKRDGLARNAGIDASSGDWILFIDDDDWFLHEFVFEKIAAKIQSSDESIDTVDFSFIWKGDKYCTQTEETHYCMVWCRAWKRSFIGDKRFDASTYGSDSNFFNAYIKNNPECNVVAIPELMYYYNYYRKGSLSQMYKDKVLPKIDIVITHYNEPWEIGKKLFDSIALQVRCNLKEINFIIVQDGEENALPWKELLAPYDLRVSVVTLKEHRGVSAARNAGIENAITDWIMFMDFDDMFADVASLAMFLTVFPPAPEVDVIWCKYIREGNDFGHDDEISLNSVDDPDYRTVGKAYKISFLNEHNIRFNLQHQEYSDMIFNTIVFSETYSFHIFAFYAQFYPLLKRYRSEGAFSSLEAIDAQTANAIDRDIIIMNEMKKRDHQPNYNEWLVRVLADTYHTIRPVDEEPDDRMGITDKIIGFWKEHRYEFYALSENDIEVVFDRSQTETMGTILNYYNYFKKEYYLQNDMVTFGQFIEFLDKLSTGEQPDIVTDEHESIEAEEYTIVDATPSTPVSKENERVVVYCGTKEVYISMIASAKSLLATTHVDKVYFLIEDDVFPYDIPDIIETRNVSNTGLFDEHGPNYQNAWTYMCLMRTAYPQMFPQYDKVLSLDIDVVITEDVGDLWDIDISDYYIAGVLEQGRVKDIGAEMYANFGVVMMNLAKLRADNMGDTLIHAVNTEHFGCPEQDAFNKFCKGHIYRLPNDYNVTVYSHITGEPIRERILHYAGLRYWKHFGPVKKYNQLSWDEVMKLQEAIDG